MVNGEPLDSLNLTNVEVTPGPGQNLVFQGVPLEYNVTTVQCIALLSNGNTQTSSNNGTLLVQGS